MTKIASWHVQREHLPAPDEPAGAKQSTRNPQFDSSLCLVDLRFQDLVFRKAGWVSPVVQVDGWAAGTWQHERTGGRIGVAVQPFGGLSVSQRRAIAEEADRLGGFLGSPAVLSFAAPV